MKVEELQKVWAKISNIFARKTEVYTRTDSDSRYLVAEMAIATTGNVEQELTANVFYKFGECDSLTLTLAEAAAGLAIYAGKFTAGSNGCTLVLPEGVELGANVADIEAGKTYEFSIMDNVLLMVEV